MTAFIRSTLRSLALWVLRPDLERAFDACKSLRADALREAQKASRRRENSYGTGYATGLEQGHGEAIEQFRRALAPVSPA